LISIYAGTGFLDFDKFKAEIIACWRIGALFRGHPEYRFPEQAEH
jgi:hypothetical protein